MYAYDYGLEHYKEKYQPKPYITIFNDNYKKITQVGEDTTLQEKPGIFVAVTQNEADPSKVRFAPSKKQYAASVIRDYMIPTGKAHAINQTVTLPGIPGSYDLYLFGTQYLVYFPQSTEIEEVYLQKKEEKPTKPEASKPIIVRTSEITKLTDDLEKANISLILFLDEDGAKIERTYQKIKEIHPREIVLFLEKDDPYNYFGSVIRVRSGSEVSQKIPLSYNELGKLLLTFTVAIQGHEVRKVLADHIKYKDSVWYYIQNTLNSGVQILNIPKEFVLQTIGDTMDSIAEGIENAIKIKSNRWKVYDKEGKLDSKYQPLLPGLTTIKKGGEALQKNTKKALNAAPVYKILETLEATIQQGIDALPKGFLRTYISKRLNVFYTIIHQAKDFVEEILQLGVLLTTNIFYYINAMLVGVINSLIDVIKGVFEIIGLVCKLIIGLQKEQEYAFQSIGSQAGLMIELLENVFGGIAQLLTLTNIKKYFDTMVRIILKFIQHPTLGITVDQIGYAEGYITGLFIEEVVLGFLTGGAKNIETAIQLAAKSFENLLGGVYKKAKRGVEFSLDSLVALIAYFKKIAINFPTVMDDILLWINKRLIDVKTTVILSQPLNSALSLSGLTAITLIEAFELLRLVAKNKWIGSLNAVGFEIYRKGNDEVAFVYKGQKIFESKLERAKKELSGYFEKAKKQQKKIEEYLDEQLRIRIERRFKNDITNYLKPRKKLKGLTGEEILERFKKKLEVVHFNPLEFYQEMIRKYPELKGGFDEEDVFRQVNIAKFKTEIITKGETIEEITELVHSGKEVISKDFINGFDIDDPIRSQFQNGLFDTVGEKSRRNDSEVKFIYNFIKNHLHKGDEFVIEAQNIYYACNSCQRELLMLIEHVESLGKKMTIKVHGDITITKGAEFYERILKVKK